MTFRRNRAQNGGAIYCLGEVEILQEDQTNELQPDEGPGGNPSSFEDNTATDDGGAVFVGFLAGVTLEEVYLTRNVAGRGWP